MVDTSTEVRKSRKKYNGDEDPIVIAQRFLNIFRQLHIFTDERKDAFNKMLMELSPEVRGTFSNLPGGGLLQDYVDDLEQSLGLTRDMTASLAATSGNIDTDAEISKAKILATALAEAQVQASARFQQTSPQAAYNGPSAAVNTTVQLDKDFSKELAGALASALSQVNLGQNNANVPPQASTPSQLNANIQIDKDFGKDLAQAVTTALQQGSQNQQEELKNLTEGLFNRFGSSQQEIISSIQSYNQDNKNANHSLTKAFMESQVKLAQFFNQRQQNTPMPSPSPIQQTSFGQGTEALKIDSSELVSVFNETQKQIAQVLAAVNENKKTESLELAKMLQESQSQMSKALITANENKKNETLQLAETLKESQGQIVKAIAILNQNHKSDNMEIVQVLKESQLEVAKMLIQSNQINANNNQNTSSNANNIQINTAVPSHATLSDEMLNGIVKVQSEILRQASIEQTRELSAIITLAMKESQKLSSQTIKEALNGLKDVNIHYHNSEMARAAPVYQQPTYQEFEPSHVVEASFSEEPETFESFSSDELIEDIPEATLYAEAINEDILENEEDFTNVAEEITSDEAPPLKKKKKKKKKKKTEVESANSEDFLLEMPQDTTEDVLFSEEASFDMNNEVEAEPYYSPAPLENEQENLWEAENFDAPSEEPDLNLNFETDLNLDSLSNPFENIQEDEKKEFSWNEIIEEEAENIVEDVWENQEIEPEIEVMNPLSNEQADDIIEDEQDWEWEYEEIPLTNTEAQPIGLETNIADPYGVVPVVSPTYPVWNAITSGNLFFQASITSPTKSENDYSNMVISGSFIKELGENGSQDPYLLNSDIKD